MVILILQNLIETRKERDSNYEDMEWILHFITLFNQTDFLEEYKNDIYIKNVEEVKSENVDIEIVDKEKTNTLIDESYVLSSIGFGDDGNEEIINNSYKICKYIFDHITEEELKSLGANVGNVFGSGIFNIPLTAQSIFASVVVFPREDGSSACEFRSRGGIDVKQVPIIKGDAKSVSIAAASIVAKVTRDRLMVEYDQVFPEYGFASNKGYGSQMHIEALKKCTDPVSFRKLFDELSTFRGHFINKI